MTEQVPEKLPGEIDLAKLAEPFPEEDVEWRVSHAKNTPNGIRCHVVAYITARAVQERLDNVCGPANWKNEPLQIFEIRPGVVAMQTGISIRINGEWVTKWNVSDPTKEEPVKGGFSGAVKRAGCEWGIGRNLYYVKIMLAEVAHTGGRGWNHATLPPKEGGGSYYWKTPRLPGWALPKEAERVISIDELNKLKIAWKKRFAPESENRAELHEGFSRFVLSVVGEFPIDDFKCWTRDALVKCLARIAATKEPNGVSADVPFEK